MSVAIYSPWEFYRQLERIITNLPPHVEKLTIWLEPDNPPRMEITSAIAGPDGMPYVKPDTDEIARETKRFKIVPEDA